MSGPPLLLGQAPIVRRIGLALWRVRLRALEPRWLYLTDVDRDQLDRVQPARRRPAELGGLQLRRSVAQSSILCRFGTRVVVPKHPPP